MINELLIPRYSQPEILQVTKLKAELLQTWINRNVLQLAEQNPGSGRRRLYSRIDVVKLALMRRIADLKMDLSVARELANEAERLLLERDGVPWELYIRLKDHEATEHPIATSVIASDGYSILSLKYGAIQGDARDMRVSSFTESFEGVFSRRIRTLGEEQPIDPAKRDDLARKGLHAEPALIFPFGEIVNGALLQLDEVDKRHGVLPAEDGSR